MTGAETLTRSSPARGGGSRAAADGGVSRHRGGDSPPSSACGACHLPLQGRIFAPSNPLQPHVGELLAEAVHVEAELAASEPPALVAFVGLARPRLLEDLLRIGAPDHADPVVV